LNPDLIGYKIVQISDIHSGSFFLKEPVKNSVQMINGLNPDIVVFTGDLVNSKTNEVEEYLDVFDKIISKQGVFSTTGNHDYGDYSEWPDEDAKKKNFQDLKDAHKKMGWDLLMNEHRIIDVKGAKIGLLGVENYSAIARFPRYGKLDQAYANLPKTDVNILLSHDPSHWDFQIRPEYPDIDLTLSGHTHGFQFGIEIPGWFRWSPSQYMYKQWAGLYQEGKQFLYVNRGLGFLGYPGRVGILPEITCITLKSA
jgi:predicted MPP superfamily phosphohydrolase